jgi:NAD-dependent oxidoreductase involved in siderophore biosynthesis
MIALADAAEHRGRGGRARGGGGVTMRTAVVGVGYLGRFHAEKYAAHPGCQLVAVVDVDGGRAREIARRSASRRRPTTARSSVASDCASIAVPTNGHFAVARDLLEGGVDVLVEKPVTTTVDEAKALVELAVRGGRVLQVGTSSASIRRPGARGHRQPAAASSSATGSRRSPSAAPTSTSCSTS